MRVPLYICKGFCLLLMVFLVAACSNTPEATPTATPEMSTSGPNESELTASEAIIGDWIVISVNNTAIATEVVPTLSFTDTGGASGEAGCNSYGGTYTTDGNGIVFAGVTSTLIACEEPAIITQETGVLNALQKASLYLIEGDTLTLTDDTGTALLVLNRDA